MYNNVDLEEFVQTWILASETNQGKVFVADKLLITVDELNKIKIALYSRGVYLPPLKKGLGGIEKVIIEKLVQIVKDYEEKRK